MGNFLGALIGIGSDQTSYVYPLCDIERIKKQTMLGMFNNSIEIDFKSEQKIFLTSFVER